jgi:hypothetical protein
MSDSVSKSLILKGGGICYQISYIKRREGGGSNFVRASLPLWSHHYVMVIICNKGAHPFIGCYIGSRASHVRTWGRVLLMWVTCISLVIITEGMLRAQIMRTCRHLEGAYSTDTSYKLQWVVTDISVDEGLHLVPFSKGLLGSRCGKNKRTEHLTKLMERYLFWQADDCPAYHKFAVFYGAWMLITFFTRAR